MQFIETDCSTIEQVVAFELQQLMKQNDIPLEEAIKRMEQYKEELTSNAR